MAAVCRKDDSLSTGHICSSTTTLATPGQSNVFVNGRLMARKTDSTVPHPFPPSPPCANHTAVVNVGSSTVFCNGLPVARVGDSADLGEMTSGSSNVNAG